MCVRERVGAGPRAPAPLRESQPIPAGKDLRNHPVQRFHLVDGEMEAQRGGGMCPGSVSGLGTECDQLQDSFCPVLPPSQIGLSPLSS